MTRKLISVNEIIQINYIRQNKYDFDDASLFAPATAEKTKSRNKNQLDIADLSSSRALLT